MLGARPLSVAEQELARSILAPRLQTIFFEQTHADQRHGLESARHVMCSGKARPDLIAAALLHDVGKRHARLGILGRVAASLLIAARFPLRARFRAYRDHGPVAAEELRNIGAPEVAVTFARHHHGPRPDDIDPVDWAILVESDQPAKTRRPGEAGISSGPA